MSNIITQIAIKYAVGEFAVNANDLMYNHLANNSCDELLHTLESDCQAKDDFLRSFRPSYRALTRLRSHEFDALNEEVTAFSNNQSNLIDKLDSLLIDKLYTALVQLIGNCLDNDFGTWSFDGSNFTPAEFMRAVNSVAYRRTSSDNYFEKLMYACEQFYDKVILEDGLDSMSQPSDIEFWVKYNIDFDAMQIKEKNHDTPTN